MRYTIFLSRKKNGWPKRKANLAVIYWCTAEFSGAEQDNCGQSHLPPQIVQCKTAFVRQGSA